MRERNNDTTQTAKPLRRARKEIPPDPLRADQTGQKKPSRGTKVQLKHSSRRRRESAAVLAHHPGPVINSEAALSAGLAALSECDCELVAHLLAVAGPPPLRARPPGLEGLIWIIVSQQLSTASASAIFTRLCNQFAPFEAAAVLAASDDRLRGCGLSAAKIRTLRALCETVGAGRLDLAGLAGLEASEAHRALVAVKGIGPWTADIFLLFCLGHPDVWPAGDLALQEAARIALGLKRRPDALKLAAIGERWRPWRGVAARLLWAYYRAVKAPGRGNARNLRTRAAQDTIRLRAPRGLDQRLRTRDPDTRLARPEGTAMPKLAGPRLAPRSGSPKQLVVFLHGYGADGNDLIEIGKQWQQFLPDAAFVAPHAPEPCAMSGTGRQWFPLTMRDPDERWRGVTQARPSLDEFLDDQLQSAGLDNSRLALVGFSQGTMMALHIGLRRPQAPAAIVGFSGVLVGAEHLGEAKARTHAGAPPPVLLVHGSQDDLIPVDALFLSANQLAAVNIPCQWHLSIGIGHGIDGGGLKHGGLFLADCFGLRPPAR